MESQAPVIVTSDLKLNKDILGYEELEFGELRKGKFVVGANGDSVRLYGLLYTNSYRQLGELTHDLVIENMNRVSRGNQYQPRIIIGGGRLSLERDSQEIILYGRSDTFGNVPPSILEACMEEYKGKFDVDEDSDDMPCYYREEGAREWYKERGIEID